MADRGVGPLAQGASRRPSRVDGAADPLGDERRLVLAFDLHSHGTGHIDRAALELDKVATWWSGLADTAKADPANFASVVDTTETILGSENASWVQEMQQAMSTLEEEGSE